MFFPVTHSVLSPQALLKTLKKQYSIQCIKQLHYFQAGLNDTYLVKTRVTKYILRVYRNNWRSEADIRCEIDVLNFLSENDIPVATAIRKIDGEYITIINAPEGIRFLVLFNYIKGTSPEFKKSFLHHATLYGKTFGRLHKTLKNFSSPYPRFKHDLDYLFFNPLKSINTQLKHRPESRYFLTRLAASLTQKINLLSVDSLRKGFCHGDLNTENVHIQNNHIGLFDFDCCGYGYISADIAAFRWGARLNANEKKIWKPFLNAYLSENSLPDIDIEAIPIFTIIRHIWHMGLHIQLSENRGQHWINDAYFERQITILKEWENLSLLNAR
jgi:Ser/Thr protein kinase RdoA (MazF antagonist)